MPSEAVSAAYLATGKKADFVQEGDALKLTLPAEPVSEYDTVIKVTL
jgi:alpha-L-fucosidase